MGYCQGENFKEHLFKLVGEFIIVYVKSGKDCCLHRGVLSNIADDFLVLIYNNLRTEISLNSIVAVKNEVANEVKKGG